MLDTLQDDSLVKADLRDHERRMAERSPWESLWRQIDERFPDGAGGFSSPSPGRVRGERNFDTTHITALDRCKAAMRAITTPESKQYIVPSFAPELMQVRAVREWCFEAGRRLQAIRHASHTGFGIAVDEDWDQVLRYGTSILWQEQRRDRSGLTYRALHLAECTIDVDEAGLVDTIDRKFKRTARQLEQFFGIDALTPKMRKALGEPGKEHTEFEILAVVAPNTQWDQDKFDWRRMPIASRYLALDEKMYLKRAGYWTMPGSAHRHVTSPGEKWGRSPSIKMLPTINGVNAMQHTNFRAAHKAVDPALLFNNDDGITSLASRPNGMNPGLVSEDGRVLVARMPGGENGLPNSMEMVEQERAVIRAAFLEEYFKVALDPNSRMTTTEVLEVMSKLGDLVRPYASRYATEKQLPMTNRDLDMALREGQIAPFPPEVVEAGAWPMIDYENELAAMARAQSVSKTLRWVEALAPMAAVDPSVYDYVDLDEVVPGIGEEIGVAPRYSRSPEKVAAMRAQRAEAEAVPVGIDALSGAAGAALDLAKANQIGVAA